ncbi:MAG: hypothetical protein M1822_005701 [Bathelium mastoideum]|nr:MAG: hypothetical protein M1822_005701 [Bathelium mastoideum]
MPQIAASKSNGATIIRRQDSLWLKALESLEGDLKAEFAFENIAYVDVPTVLFTLVQDKKQICLKKRWKFKRSNGEEIVLRDVFEKIAFWLKKFKAIGDVVVQYDPAYSALPWAGVRFILQVAVNYTDIFSSILLGVKKVSRLITRYAILEELYLQRTYNGRVELESLLVDLYQESAFHSAEDDQLQNIDASEAKVLRFIRLVDTELQLGTAKEVNSVHHLLQSLEAPIARLVDQAFLFEKTLNERKYLDILRWISPVPYARHHERHSEGRLLGTAKWLLQHSEYRSWMASSSSSTLLLHGILGSGKTALASAVIDDLVQRSSSEPLRCPVTYFYCARSAAEPECSRAEEAIRSILRQLSISRDSKHTINEALVTRHERQEAEAKLDGFDMIRMTTKECLDVLLEITSFNPLMIVVDAVDQIEEQSRYELLSALQDLCTGSASLIKVFLTSRDDQDVFNLLPDTRKIRITKEDNCEDTELFARHQVSQSILQGRLLRGKVSDDLLESLVVALVDGAQEMFQWIKLQLQHLCQFKLESDVKAAMRRLSGKNLSELYAEAYDRIFMSNSSARNVASRTFSWLLCMKENLTPEALLMMSQLEHQDRIEFVNLLEVCHNFIVHDSKLNVLRFAHNSIQDFIKGKPDFAMLSVNKLVALDCLNLCIAGPQSEMQTVAPGFQDAYHYSTMHWAVHCQAADPEFGDDEVWHKMKDFIFNGPDVSLSFIVWLDDISDVVESLSRDHPLKKPLSAVPNQQQSPLFAGCVFGLVEVVKKLASHNDTLWDQVNDQGHTGLYLAAAGGHDNAVHAMLGFPVDVNAVGGRYTYPIHAACLSGHSSIVRSLLDSGADPKLRGIFDNAFHAALVGGREDIAVLLLKSGRFQLVDQSEYDAAFKQAAQAGFLNVVQTLEGAYKSIFTISTQSANRSVLDAIIYKGQLGMLEKLLAMKSARTASLPPDAISKAAFGGHDGMVSNLIQRGLDLEVEGPFGTPLRAASLMGHESTVRLLVDKGANVNTDSPLGDPLQAAAMNGHISVTKTLIEGHANVNKVGGFFGNALQAAAYRGHLATVELLLDAKAKIYQEGFSKDVFHAAAEGGHENIIRALVKKGHSFQHWVPPILAGRKQPLSPPFNLLRSNSPGQKPIPKRGYATLNRQTTKKWPASTYVSDIYNTLSLVRDLVEKRAMNQPHAYGTTYDGMYDESGPNYALQAAALSGHEAVVSRIIEEYHEEDRRKDRDDPFRYSSVSWGEGPNALKNAATNGHEGVVRLLINSKFAPLTNIQQPMKAAAEGGYLSTVKMLLAFEDDLILSKSSAQEGDSPGLPDIRNSNSYGRGTRYIYDEEESRGRSSLEIVLLAACRSGHLPVTKYALDIVQERFSADERHELLAEAIRQSARHGMTAVLDFLLTSDFEMTPDLLNQTFEYGCNSGHQEIISLLINADKNGSVTAETSQKGLELCVRNGFFDLIAFLVRADSANHSLSLTEDMLVTASGNGDCEILCLLLEERRRRHSPHLLLDRLLNIACYNGHKDVVEILVAFGASVDAIVEEVRTNPLGQRSGFNSYQMMESDKGTKRNALQAALHGSSRFQSYGKYAFLQHENGFIEADQKCHEATLQYLIEKSANLNALGGCSDIPLICTIKYCSKEIVALMIERGADFRARRLYKDKDIENITASGDFSSDGNFSSDSKSEYEVKTQTQGVDTAGAHGGESAGAIPGAYSRNVALREALDFFSYDGFRLEGRTVKEVLETGPGAVVQLLLNYLPEERADHESYRLMFQMAAMDGRHELMTLLIDRGFDVNATGSYYGTPLQAAARFGRIEILRILLEAGADVNVLQGAHGTPIRAAVRGRHVDIVKLLLNNDANPNLRHRDTEAIMQLALNNVPELAVDSLPDADGITDSADGGDSPTSTFPTVDANIMLTRLLLAHGADVNAVAERTPDHSRRGRRSRRASYTSEADLQNVSSIQLAASRGRHDLVELLIQHGARIDPVSTGEMSPLQCGARSGHASIVRLLVDKGVNVNHVFKSTDGRLHTALSFASSNERPETVEELLRAGAVISDLPSIPNALTVACENRKFVAAMMLLEELSRSSTRERTRNDALLAASERSDDTAFKLLLEHALPIDPQRKEGSVGYALHVSAYHLRPNFVLQLVQHGANTNLLHPHYGSPLIAALEGCALPVLIHRAEYSTDGSFTRAFGPEKPTDGSQIHYRSSLDAAEVSECLQVVQTLLDSGADANTELREFGNSIHLAAFIGNLTLMQLLLQRGGILHVQGGCFGSPLLAALDRDDLDMVALLLDRGVDVRCLSSQGRSALQYAFMASNHEAARLLLDRGADINGHDGEVSSPLAAAFSSIVWNQNGQKAVEELVTLLLRCKATLEIKESDLIALAGAGNDDNSLSRYRHIKDTAFGLDGLSQVLRGDGQLRITEPVLEAVMLPKVMKLLLEHENVCEITSRIVEKAASRPMHGLDLVDMLVSRQSNFQVTEPLILGVLRASNGYRTESEQQRTENILQNLISRNMDLGITEEMLREAQTPSEMQILLKPIPHHRVSDELLETVATRAEHPSKIYPDGALVFGSEENLAPRHSLVKVLLEHDKQANITPKLVHKACDSPDAIAFLTVLLDHDPEVTILEDDFIALLSSKDRRFRFDNQREVKRQKDLISVLLKYDRRVTFTDEVREAIDRKTARHTDERLKSLYRQLEKQG